MPSLSHTDPLQIRARELLVKHLPPEAALWLKPPGDTPQHHPESRFWHPWCPEHTRLLETGWKPLQDGRAWDRIVLFCGKQKEENRELLRAAQERLTPQGRLYLVLPNDYGAKSFQKELSQSGTLLEHHSGRKSRLFLLSGASSGESSEWYRLRDNGLGHLSCPGLFSWNKADLGSRLLAETLADQNLRGPVADLGAGWGFLGRSLPSQLELHVLEADLRGVEACRQNLEERNLHAHWTDLSDPTSLPDSLLNRFGSVITNPPFHTHKRSEPVLGGSFVATASRLLRQRGCLYLVGNVHLPYRKIMEAYFSKVELLSKHQGFQVFKGEKA